MARVPCIVTAKVLIILNLYLSTTVVNSEDKFAASFDSLFQSNNITKNANFNKVRFEVRGRNIYPDLEIKTTKEKAARNTLCIDENLNYPIENIVTKNDSAVYEISVPRDTGGDFYLCLPHKNPGFTDGNKMPPNLLQGGPKTWHHQGPEIVVKVPYDTTG